jgi:endonuclease/exonuclease/phosphatase (EEP) superfamily protein YafD
MSSPLRLLTIVAAILLIGANLATLIGLLASTRWPAELFTHFPAQYAVAQIIAIAVFLALRPRWPGLVTLPLLAFNLWLLAPYYWQGVGANAATHPGGTLRVMTLNMNAENPRADLVLQAIEAENPDLLLLLEITPGWWEAAPAAFRERYPYRASEIADSPFGIALLSRLPFAFHDIFHFGIYGRPAIAAQLCPPAVEASIAASCIHVVAVHPDPPMTPNMARSRDGQLMEVGEYLRGVPEKRRIVLGDMNATPWSPVLADFMAATGLRDSALGRGLHPTWFSQWPFLGIPIDQILVSDGITVLDSRVGPDVGSDHFPVTADLAIAAAE